MKNVYHTHRRRRSSVVTLRSHHERIEILEIKRTAPLVYNTQSGLSPREVPFRSIDLGEVALRPYPT